MPDLVGRVALVTGGSSGIGAATVKRFVADGALVVSGDIRPPKETFRGADYVEVDLAEAPGASRLVDETLRLHGRLDIVVNNVGAAPTRTGLSGTTDNDWAATWNLNLMSAVRVTRSAELALVSSGRGAVVMVASTTGRTPTPYFVDYAVSKAGLIVLTKALAEEFGPRGIRVNSVSPGSIRTPLWDLPGGFVDSLADRLDLERDAALARYVVEEPRISLGRVGSADEVAPAIAFLASSEASYITGVDLVIDGGSTKSI